MLATSHLTGVLLLVGAFAFLAIASRLIFGRRDWPASWWRPMGRGGAVGRVGDGPDFKPPPDESEGGLE